MVGIAQSRQQLKKKTQLTMMFWTCECEFVQRWFCDKYQQQKRANIADVWWWWCWIVDDGCERVIIIITALFFFYSKNAIAHATLHAYWLIIICYVFFFKKRSVRNENGKIFCSYFLFYKSVLHLVWKVFYDVVTQ